MSDYDAGEQADQLIADALAWRRHQAEVEATARAAVEANRAVDADRQAMFQTAGLVDPTADPDDGRDPGRVGLDKFHEALAAGKRREDAAANVINRLTAAAIKGDKRVLIRTGEGGTERAWTSDVEG
jgi:hypothetical protein